MKTFSFLILIFLYSNTIIAQGEDIGTKQFMLGVTNVGSFEEVTHYIEAIGSAWEYNSGNFIISSNQNIYNNSVITTGNANFSINDWPGFNFSWLDIGYQMPRWGLSVYKITNSKQTDKYFYLDSRDSDYGARIYSIVDFYIYFDNTDDNYYHRHTNNLITQGAVVRVWDIFEESPNTSGLQNYWSNALLVTNNGNDNPRLVWGPYPSPGSLPGTITGYKVYRSATHIPGQTPSNFTLLATINDPDVYEYVDNSVTMGSDYNARSYYVKTVYEDQWESSGESSPTNIVEVRLQIPQKIKANNNYITLKDFSLEQNYPNPFNPITVINYSIPEDSKVQIKVYDMLGIEVAELVNENKATGNYEVTFEALNLSSGVYIYRITALNGERILFTRSKQMLLMK